MTPLAPRVLAGDVRAASRLMRQVEDGQSSAVPELQALFPHTGRAYVIGVTGRFNWNRRQFSPSSKEM